MEQFEEQMGTICSHWDDGCLLKNISSRRNKYAVKKKSSFLIMSAQRMFGLNTNIFFLKHICIPLLDYGDMMLVSTLDILFITLIRTNAFSLSFSMDLIADVICVLKYDSTMNISRQSMAYLLF